MYLYVFRSVSCCFWTLSEILKPGKNMFKRTVSSFPPVIPGSSLRSVSDTMALVPVMLQFFHFFPASNHFTNGPILTYVKTDALQAAVPQIYTLSPLPSQVTIAKCIIKIT
jgi:hypothetical protein